MKHSKKIGAITVEVAIGIALAVIVVLVTLGLFSENLANMISSSGIANMFKNTNKTTYSSFNRDYTNSQINVQLIGEQGLAMLRSIANNKAIEQIDKYMDGADTSVINANSIAYLAIAINSIVGSPDICVYMKKDSDKKCDQDGIGGYSYRINLNGGSITIRKEGGGIAAKYPALSGDFTGGTSGITIRKNIGGAQQTFQPAAALPTSYNPISIGQTSIYKYIKEISLFAEQSKTVYEHVILLKAGNTGKSLDNPPMTPEQAKAIIVNEILQGSAASLKIAHDSCTQYGWLSGNDKNYPDVFSDSSECGYPFDGYSHSFVDKGEVLTIKDYTNQLTSIINNIDSPDILDIVNALINRPDFTDFINLLQEDHKKNSCANFTTVLKRISDANDLNINIPACVPYDLEWVG